MSSKPTFRSTPSSSIRPALAFLTLALGLLIGLAALSGCGRKEPPLPPLRFIPAGTEDLTVAQQGQELIFRFTYPSRTVDGMPLSEVREVQLWALTRPALKPAVEGAPVPTPQPVDSRQLTGAGRLVESLRGDDLASILWGDQVVMRLPVPELGDPPLAYFFAARTLSRDPDPSELSNQAVIVPRPAPTPPEGLELTPGQDGVTVSWKAAPDTPEGGATQGFHVYRRNPQTRLWGAPLHRTDAGAVSWTDTSAQFGERYIYSVTRVVATSPLIESAPGGAREIDHQDRFPPPPPRNVVALGEEGRVRLVWEASPAPDVAGYRVYRVPARGVLEAATEEPVDGLEYVDRGLPTGARVGYRVSAVDRAGNEGEPGPEIQATVR